ncbi:MAG: TolC family protein [Proteobacteria bacterium]|nr:TolC family protein [Pseudomonadota bacterium]
MNRYLSKSLFLILISISFYLIPLSLPASVQAFTLNEAIRIGLEKNPNILRAQEDINVAKSQTLQARSALIPKIDAKATYMPNSLEKTAVPEAFKSVMPDLDMTNEYSLELNFVQPLFSGGKIWYANQQASLNVSVSREKLRQTQNELILSITQAFDGVILAREYIQVMQEAINLTEENLQVIRARYRNGETLEFEVLRAEVELLNLKPQLIEARNKLELANSGLKFLLGMDPSEKIEVSGSLTPSEFNPDLNSCLQTALEKRPEVAQLNYQKKIVHHLVKYAQAGYSPDLAAVFQFTEQSFNHINKGWEKGYNGLLVLSVPIFNGFYTHGKIKEAKGLLASVSIGLNQLKDGIRLEVEQAYLNLNQSREIVAASQETVKKAERSVEIAKAQYAVGYITSLDMMGARLALTQARTSYLKSLYDFIVAKAQMEKAMGTIGEKS